MANLLEIAKKLNKEFKNDGLATIASVVPSYKRFSCGDLGADFPLYGGLPLGRLIVFAGKEHSGKTTAACLFMAAYQREFPDKVCVFIDVEHSLDKEFQANMTGLDLTKLIYVNPENMSGEQILDLILEYQAADDIGMIILDSIPAMVSSTNYDSDVEEDKGQAGNMARPLGKFITKILDQLSAKQNSLILINQVREKKKKVGPVELTTYEEPGGHSPKYYASVKVRFGTRSFTKAEDVERSDGEEADGFRLKFAITKNKTASTQRGGGFLTFRYDTGLDWSFDTLEVALKYEFIKRPNNQIYQMVNPETGELLVDKETKEPLSFRGKEKVKDYLNTHVEFQKEYLKMLNDYIAASGNHYGSLLDERELAKIKAEEEAVKEDGDE